MVERCVCRQITFAELLRLREEHGWNLEQMKEQTGCCTGCSSCEPYVRLMISTGRTSFPVLSPRECASAMRED